MLAPKHRGTAANAGRPPKHPPPPTPVLRKSCRLLVRGLGSSMSAPREKCEIPFFEKNGPPGGGGRSGLWPLCVGQRWNLVGISSGKSRGQQRSLQWCGASFIHTWLLASWGSWGISTRCLSLALLSFPWQPGAPFQQIGKMCLLNLWIGSQPPPEACWER